jgi:hypothetical protein
MTIAALVGLLAAGCGGVRDAILMPNPLVAGSVAPNRAQEHRDYFEQLYQLDKGVADTEASIVSLDDRTLCIKTQLKWIAEKGEPTDNDGFVDLNLLLPKLTANPVIAVGKPRVEADKLTQSPLTGRSSETQHEQSQICDQNGHHCESVITKRSVMKDNRMVLRNGGGTLCFDHGGTINKLTQWLVLILSPPTHPDAETHRYAWQFPPPAK